MPYLIEVGKFLIPALLSSSVTTIYFQKRLKRLGSYEAITQVLLQRMWDGADEVFKEAQYFNAEVLAVNAVLKEQGDIKQLWNRLSSAWIRCITTIRAHRIYVTTFVPYGKSCKMSNAVQGLLEWLELLEDYDSPSNNYNRAMEGVQRQIQILTDEFYILRERIESAKNNILAGKLP